MPYTEPGILNSAVNVCEIEQVLPLNIHASIYNPAT